MKKRRTIKIIIIWSRERTADPELDKAERAKEIWIGQKENAINDVQTSEKGLDPASKISAASEAKKSFQKQADEISQNLNSASPEEVVRLKRIADAYLYAAEEAGQVETLWTIRQKKNSLSRVSFSYTHDNEAARTELNEARRLAALTPTQRKAELLRSQEAAAHGAVESDFTTPSSSNLLVPQVKEAVVKRIPNNNDPKAMQEKREQAALTLEQKVKLRRLAAVATKKYQEMQLLLVEHGYLEEQEGGIKSPVEESLSVEEEAELLKSATANIKDQLRQNIHDKIETTGVLEVAMVEHDKLEKAIDRYNRVLAGEEVPDEIEDNNNNSHHSKVFSLSRFEELSAKFTASIQESCETIAYLNVALDADNELDDAWERYQTMTGQK